MSTNAARVTNSSPSLCPHDHLVEREGSVVEQVLVALVADLPGVEALGPAIHLTLGHPFGARRSATRGSVPREPCPPECESKLVVAPDTSRQRAQRRRPDAEGARPYARPFQRRDALRLARLRFAPSPVPPRQGATLANGRNRRLVRLRSGGIPSAGVPRLDTNRSRPLRISIARAVTSPKTYSPRRPTT
jgi:hypothetical protein